MALLSIVTCVSLLLVGVVGVMAALTRLKLTFVDMIPYSLLVAINALALAGLGYFVQKADLLGSACLGVIVMCVSRSTYLLADGKPVFSHRFRIRVRSLSDDAASNDNPG